MSASELHRQCLAARRAFFSWRSMASRCRDASHLRDPGSWRDFWMVNLLHRAELTPRDGHPLGDEAWPGELLRVP